MTHHKLQSNIWKTCYIGGISIISNVTFATVGAAQNTVIPDDTLGAEQSVVAPFNQTIDLITGGAVREQNLFHSFEEFSIGNGDGAYFITDAETISNIFARVTGNNISNIQGILGTRLFTGGNFVLTDADLFLINPNGIVFGENAVLDVGGSFTATTASGVEFDDTGRFSAVNPEAPSLLTINPSAYFFTHLTPGSIINRSTSGQSFPGLRAPNHETLTFLGGDIAIDGGGQEAGLHAWGGRVEIGAMGGIGNVQIGADGNLLFSDTAPLADVTLTNKARVNVSLDGGGDIGITARNIEMTGDSALLAGIYEGLGDEMSVAGDIVLRASERIRMDNSDIENSVGENSTGQGGDILVETPFLELFDFSYLSSHTSGFGNAGNVNIHADYIFLEGFSKFSSNVRSDAIGNGGDVEIVADSLTSSIGFIATRLDGSGKAGDIRISAPEINLSRGAIYSHLSSGGESGNIEVVSESIVLSDADISTDAFGQGDGGDIRIFTNSLLVEEGARLRSRTFEEGNAGNIFISAQDTVVFDGRSPFSHSSDLESGAFSNVEPGAQGHGGNIEIRTGTLVVSDDAQLRADTEGIGNAGNIVINAQDFVVFDTGGYAFSNVASSGRGEGGNVAIITGSLSVLNGAQLIANTRGEGDAGNVIINARDSVIFDNASGPENFPSGAISRVESNGVGQGGNVAITTGSLSVLNGAHLSADTRGDGNAGDVIINARDSVIFDNANGPDNFPSGAFSRVGSNGMGQGGDVEITTGSLSILNGAILSASTWGEGNAGDVIINAQDAVIFDDVNGDGKFTRGALSRVGRNAVGQGGNVEVTAGSLAVSNGAILATSTRGEGDAGNLIIDARNGVLLSDNGVLRSNVEAEAVGDAGQIRVTSGSLSLINGAEIVSSTAGRGDAGEITIEVQDFVILRNDADIRSDVLGETTLGDGGDIQITAASLFMIGDDSWLSSYTEGTGDAGNISIFATDVVELDDANIYSDVESGAVGNGGDIQIVAGSFYARNAALLESDTSGEGHAGNVSITAADTVLFEGTSSDGNYISAIITATTENATGDGGSIYIDSENLILRDGARFSTRTLGEGDAGNVVIETQAATVLEDSSELLTYTAGQGTGGRISILTDSLLLNDRASFNTTTSSSGHAGDVAITANSSATFIDSDIFSKTFEGSEGQGGDIQLNVGALSLLEGAHFQTQTAGQGHAGNVSITAADTVLIEGSNPGGDYESAIITASTEEAGGNGGRIYIASDNLILRDSARFSTRTSSEGNAGDIVIATQAATVLADGAQILADTVGQGDGGNIVIATDSLLFTNEASFDTTTSSSGNAGDVIITANGSATFINSYLLSYTLEGSKGQGGDVELNVGSLSLFDVAQFQTWTAGQGRAGNVTITAQDTVRLDGNIADGQFSSAIFSDVESTATGGSGDIQITARDISLTNGALLYAASMSNSAAGNIRLTAQEDIILENSDIETISDYSFGGEIALTITNLFLRGDSDIRTRVFSGTGHGGDITLTADGFIIALDDSDIIAAASEGQGGNITLNTPGFFGQNFTLASLEADPDVLDGNDRVDINATGAVNGVVTLPDISFVEDSLNSLPDAIIAPEQLLAGSCIARADDAQGSFVVTGSGGMPARPGAPSTSTFQTGTVRAVANTSALYTADVGQPDTPMMEPSGVYQLADGRVVLSHPCE